MWNRLRKTWSPNTVSGSDTRYFFTLVTVAFPSQFSNWTKETKKYVETVQLLWTIHRIANLLPPSFEWQFFYYNRSTGFERTNQLISLRSLYVTFIKKKNNPILRWKLSIVDKHAHLTVQNYIHLWRQLLPVWFDIKIYRSAHRLFI